MARHDADALPAILLPCLLTFVPFAAVTILPALPDSTSANPILIVRRERHRIGPLPGIEAQFVLWITAYFHARHQRKRQDRIR